MALIVLNGNLLARTWSVQSGLPVSQEQGTTLPFLLTNTLSLNFLNVRKMTSESTALD